MKEIVNDGFAKVVKPYMDAQDKKSREIIAPVEVSPAEAAHSAGDHIIFNGILYDVIAPIAINDALSTSGAGANIRAADNIEAQIKATKSQIQTAAAQAAAQNKNTQEMIAPVEEDETDASRAYAIGEQLILDGILYKVIDAIAQHGIITTEGAGANIEVADSIAEQIKNNPITTDPVPTSGSTNPVQSNGVYQELASINTELASKADTEDLSQVATSGDYDDLNNKPTIPNATSIDHTGTASSTGVRYQRIGIGNTYTEIDGTKYMEQTQTLSTSSDTVFTFTNAEITADSEITPKVSVYGKAPSAMTIANGLCTITFPPASSAISLKVRIYIR